MKENLTGAPPASCGLHWCFIGNETLRFISGSIEALCLQTTSVCLVVRSLLFDRWCSATKTTSFDALRELVLLEDFKNCLPERILIYLNEQRVCTLQQAAISADEFALTHKSVFKRDHVSTTNQDEEPVQPELSTSPKSSRPKQCFYCHKTGHLISDCDVLRRCRSTEPKPKGVALVKTCPAGPTAVSPLPATSPDECFKPFIFEAFVSVPGESKLPVRVLRDTGGSQSFILSGVLPLGHKTDCKASTVVRGIGLDCVPAPLHNIHFESDLVSGVFPVAVRDRFPIDGVDVILGNDIADGKVYPSPEVGSQPIVGPHDDLASQHPDVSSVSVLSRAQAKKVTQESVVDLGDPVCGPVFPGDCVPPSGLVENGVKVKPKAEKPEGVPVVPPPLTRGPLKELKGRFLSSSLSGGGAPDFVSKRRKRRQQGTVLARKALSSSQAKKKRFDGKAAMNLDNRRTKQRIGASGAAPGVPSQWWFLVSGCLSSIMTCLKIQFVHDHKAELVKIWITDKSDFSEWLCAIGLPQYHKKLSENGYDSISIVKDLTWEDLQEIGITKLGHQKKLMLAVKKLSDIQRAILQAESGQGTLRRRAPAALHLVAIEQSDASGECSSPLTPKMLTFQDSDLSAELQTAMSGHDGGCEDGLAIKNVVRMSQSQESIDARSRGSGRSQEPPTASITPHSWSQESLEGSPARERNLPEGWDQSRAKQVPLGTATVFKYPAIPAKPKLPGHPGTPPHGSPVLKGFSYLHSHCGSADPNSSPRHENHSTTLAPPTKRSQTRYALSDGEPDEDDEEPSVSSGNVPSYATLTRKPGCGQLARLQSSPEKNVGRSQSFAVRARKKGPPPPPPKRLSSVSSTTSGELSDSSSTSSGGVVTDSPGSVRSIAASLEGGAEGKNQPGSKPKAAQPESPPLPLTSTESHEAAVARKKVQSEYVNGRSGSSTELDRGVKSDSEEEESKGGGLDGSSSPQNSSSECIPFAEEGNLTIKQRPKAPGPPRAEAVLEPPDKAKNSGVPEFNLKESDTVKRRHKPKDKEGSPCREGAESQSPRTSRPSSLNHDAAGLRVSEAALERPASPATGSPVRPPLSPKPPAVAPKPVRHSLLAAQGLSSPTVTVSVVQSVAFGSQSPPAHCPSPHPQRPRPPRPLAAPPSQRTGLRRPRWVPPPTPPPPESSCDTEVVQQRLDQTSTSLAAALKAVETKLNQQDPSEGRASSVKSAGTILDDIGNMFDDLADQLDAMLD
ncbi:uncharacterized protein LOC115386902 [Salarias fasciatus]|uniref:uncharacterized protein LOC115386902 n=1 Tax=Salarias fasciatus TaxID=181472 RepID=UPI0011766665|nr:uncharacterized protein LOC115386902 [Salarias fasciatus]